MPEKSDVLAGYGGVCEYQKKWRDVFFVTPSWCPEENKVELFSTASKLTHSSLLLLL